MLAGKTAEQAYLDAGYKTSREAARRHGSRLMTNGDVAAALEKAREKAAEGHVATARAVLEELTRIALFRKGRLYRENGSLKDPSEWDEDVAAVVAGVEVFEELGGRGDDRRVVGFTKKVKTWDKVKALELLGKHHKLFTEKHEHTGKDGGPIRYGFAELTDDELDAEIRRLQGRAGAVTRAAPGAGGP